MEREREQTDRETSSAAMSAGDPAVCNVPNTEEDISHLLDDRGQIKQRYRPALEGSLGFSHLLDDRGQIKWRYHPPPAHPGFRQLHLNARGQIVWPPSDEDDPAVGNVPNTEEDTDEDDSPVPCARGPIP